MFGINVDRILSGITLLRDGNVWWRFCHDHKLDLVVCRETLTGRRYNDNILEPMVYPHFHAQSAACPVFQNDNARPHRTRIVKDSMTQEGIGTL